ncbi:uncharacterized protein LOC128335951 [Hemicordylus capensis]|uniref:uncharacterized protein LOC128335951 n=1 Tax=Hemicordylus capensis TaxID=884348 RepID=UPI002302B873|nr:uncharacterized protein LOC128335951 [Hemicordylus capensis]XP_053130892.1 uncharacterized protein LOC128335951 [Hemicordylus capensis]
MVLNCIKSVQQNQVEGSSCKQCNPMDLLAGLWTCLGVSTEQFLRQKLCAAPASGLLLRSLPYERWERGGKVSLFWRPLRRTKAGDGMQQPQDPRDGEPRGTEKGSPHTQPSPAGGDPSRQVSPGPRRLLPAAAGGDPSSSGSDSVLTHGGCVCVLRLKATTGRRPPSTYSWTAIEIFGSYLTTMPLAACLFWSFACLQEQSAVSIMEMSSYMRL